MADDESHIRTLIESWAKAVHQGDLEGVLADHADDIVMFDVPPPSDGVRGIDDYRETWPPFFTWQKQGASFEIISLDVTAGEDVAFALLRCGTQEELSKDPENRLRLNPRSGSNSSMAHKSVRKGLTAIPLRSLEVVDAIYELRERGEVGTKLEQRLVSQPGLMFGKFSDRWHGLRPPQYGFRLPSGMSPRTSTPRIW